jgi:hypothetical protein
VPKNPRYIKDERYNALKKSIQDLPDMLALREVIAYDKNGDNSELVIIAGNMRFRAMRELGFKDCSTKILAQDKHRKYCALSSSKITSRLDHKIGMHSLTSGSLMNCKISVWSAISSAQTMRAIRRRT